MFLLEGRRKAGAAGVSPGCWDEIVWAEASGGTAAVVVAVVVEAGLSWKLRRRTRWLRKIEERCRPQRRKTVAVAVASARAAEAIQKIQKALNTEHTKNIKRIRTVQNIKEIPKVQVSRQAQRVRNMEKIRNIPKMKKIENIRQAHHNTKKIPKKFLRQRPLNCRRTVHGTIFFGNAAGGNSAPRNVWRGGLRRQRQR